MFDNLLIDVDVVKIRIPEMNIFKWRPLVWLRLKSVEFAAILKCSFLNIMF